MEDGPGGERDPTQTLSAKGGPRAAINGLESYFREYVKGKSEVASETSDLPVAVSRLMTCERK